MIYAKWLRGDEDLSQAYAVREAVFVREQGFAAEIEQDETDLRAAHALLIDEDGQPAGTARLFIDEEGYWHIGRVCVLKEKRGKHLGDLLMRMVLDKALRAGAKHFRLGAQADKLPFYEKYGFWPYGEPYLDEGVPHLHMEADEDSVREKVFGGCEA
ncbi:MAG: GNAT family N-acetyltransferase [Christensenellaceae bacterium]|jgi:predicted GNAT family N-acyltransferase|nr:GNAT family N-acetyltransferase [Christensenellaceae bacterium]